MKLLQLRYFYAVANLSSVTLASDRLRIAQPALTRHIKSLEEELGVRLFSKSGRGIVLTEQGRFLLRRVATILAELDDLPSDIKTLNTGSQCVRLGMPTALGGLIGSRLVDDVRASSRFELQVVDGWSAFVVDWLDSERLDVGIIYDNTLEGHDLSHEPLALEEQFLVCGRRDALAGEASVSLADAARLSMILPGKDHGLRRFLDTRLTAGPCGFTPTMEIDSMATIKDILHHGRCAPRYSIMGECEVRYTLPASLTAVPLGEPTLNRVLYLVWSRRMASTKGFTDALASIRRAFAAVVEDGRWGSAYLGAPVDRVGCPSAPTVQ